LKSEYFSLHFISILEILQTSQTRLSYRLVDKASCWVIDFIIWIPKITPIHNTTGQCVYYIQILDISCKRKITSNRIGKNYGWKIGLRSNVLKISEKFFVNCYRVEKMEITFVNNYDDPAMQRARYVGP